MSTPWRGLSRPGRPRLLPSPGQCPQRTCRGPGGWAGARDSRPQPSCPARSPAVGPPVPLTCPRSWCELSAPETTVVTWQPYPGNRLRAPASRQRPPRGPEVWARPEMVGRVPGAPGVPSPQGHPWPPKTPKSILDLGPGPTCLQGCAAQHVGSPTHQTASGAQRGSAHPKGKWAHARGPASAIWAHGVTRVSLLWGHLLASCRAGRGPQNV